MTQPQSKGFTPVPTFTDLLPPSKTAPNRVMHYTPACRGVGVVVIEDAKTTSRYAVSVQPFGGVRFTKPGGEENYVVTVGECECAAFTLRGYRCKHIETAEGLLANRWLEHDGRETAGDKYERADEMDAYYAGQWGGEFDDTNEPDRMEDDEHADALGRRLCVEMGGA